MLSITGNHFKTGDRTLIRKYTNYVLNKFVRKGTLKKARINIKVLDVDEIKNDDDLSDLIKYRAWCTYDGNENDIKKFTIVLKASQMREAKTLKTRMKNLQIDLGHELVHVKQYLNGELRDYVDGSYRFLGNKYQPIPDGDISDEYFDSPSEIEAYGRELGLYRMFWHKVKSGEIVL
jgi:hypothetical protein